MELDEALFPPDYWRESDSLAPLSLLPDRSAGFALVRQYIGQEDRPVRRVIATAEGREAAEALIELYRRALDLAPPLAGVTALAC